MLSLYEQSEMWSRYHCIWVGTHRDGNVVRKLWYLTKGFVEYVVLLPFYDIVHIHFSLHRSAKRKLPYFLLARALGKKTIIHLHCGSQIDEIWSPVYQTMFERCDCGILLSEGLKQKIEAHIGQSKKLEVVYNPCPRITRTTQYEKKNQILFSGTLYEKKGYKDLIRAFAKVAEKYTDWKLVFLGNGEEDLAMSLAKDLGITEQVVMLGWVNGEEKHKSFCEAKALCLPSYAEGFPMAVLDAWAYGLPVITTPVGGIPDVAVDGENMLLFNPGDIDTLSKSLELIMSDKALRDQLSAASDIMAKEKFNLNIVTEQITAIYDTLLQH